jgi:hypothetical protein
LGITCANGQPLGGPGGVEKNMGEMLGMSPMIGKFWGILKLVGNLWDIIGK